MSLGRKILIGFIVCALTLFGVSIFSFRNSEKIVESGEWVSHTNQVLYEFEQIRISAVDAETGVRGYIITGDAAFLEPYNYAIKRIWEHTDRVQKLSADNPVQQKNIEVLRSRILAHLDFLEKCIEARQTDVVQARSMTSSGKGKQLADAIRSSITASKDIENELLVQREAQNTEDVQSFNVVFGVLIAVIILVLVFMFFIINSNLNRIKEAEKRTSEKNWLLTGNSTVAEQIQGEKETENLANDVIGKLTEYLGAQVGAMYIVQEDEISLVGTYACHATDANRTYKFGEGLVGQVARDRQPVILGNIPENYLRINSGFGETKPGSIIIYPFMYDGIVKGVLEIGSLNSFSENDMQLLKLVDESIGIGVNSAESRAKLVELLEETRRQSEELQQQQEELRQTNEELEEHSQKLKEQQDELQASNEELEQQTRIVEEKNQGLEAARTDIELKAKQLEITSKYKSEFLANMSHELRTPLNSLLILSKDLLDNKDGNLSADQLESAEIITKSGYDLLNLINEILDLSKVEAGKMDLNLHEVEVNAIANDLKRNFRRNIEEKGLKLEVTVDESLPGNIQTDRQRLDQVLRNLLSNAIKFTDKGKISVSFIRDAGDNLAIVVKDTGIGIRNDKLDIIFEAFQQADGGTSRKYGGTGLGLSISREMAKLLGGRITVQSEFDKGSTFTLIIPLRMNAAQPTDQNSIVEPHKVESNPQNKQHFLNYPSLEDQRDDIGPEDHTILIIEDDLNFARILASQAKEKGFKHLNASTGEDGLALAARYMPTAIILDIDLPGIDGHMVLKELKGNPNLRHIPVHIMSVNERTLDPIRSGAVEYLTKPVKKEQLDEAFGRIEDMVSRKMKNLLIVEDNDILRKSIVKLIGNGDVKCIEAGTAKQVLETMKTEVIDCMVLDIGLPDMSGFELIKKIEEEFEGKVPPIIIYTGKDLSRSENEELQQYAETIIVKGVKSEERLLDETALFLHRAVGNLPHAKQNIIVGMYDEESLFRGKKVLVVDDDMRNVFALSKVLKEKGLEIVKAENGHAALEALKNHPDTDLVLMDIMMPEMDGYECMQEIRKLPQWKDLPIIALTAKAMKEDRQKCIDAGANDYFTKPVDLERLLSLMRVWIKK